MENQQQLQLKQLSQLTNTHDYRGDLADMSDNEIHLGLELKLLYRQTLLDKKNKLAKDLFQSSEKRICMDCQKEIPESRIKARPCALTCIECKEESERFEREKPYVMRSHTIGRSVA